MFYIEQLCESSEMLILASLRRIAAYLKCKVQQVFARDTLQVRFGNVFTL